MVSCCLLRSKEDGKLSIKLEPRVAEIGEPVSLVINNNTNELYRYHRGHGVERRDNDHWVRHQQVGTFLGPVDIAPGEQFIQENILLDATEPGVYRVVLIIRTEEEPFPDTRRPSEPVEFVAVLVDDVKQPGMHEVVFDATGLTSGLYTARMSTPNIQTSGIARTINMLLIK